MSRNRHPAEYNSAIRRCSAELHSANLSRQGDGERDCWSIAKARRVSPSERARASQSQVFNLRGVGAGRQTSRLKTCDTADYKSALPTRGLSDVPTSAGNPNLDSLHMESFNGLATLDRLRTFDDDGNTAPACSAELHSAYPGIQAISLAGEETDGTRDQIGDFRTLEPAHAAALIEVALHFPSEVPLEVFQVFGNSDDSAEFFGRVMLGVEAMQSFGSLRFELEQHRLGQGISQTEGNKISGAFAFDVWQISTGVGEISEQKADLQNKTHRP